jgi:hypothetical protein
VHKSEDDTVELLKNSDPTIYYKLIPFEQGEEIWINHDKKTFIGNPIGNFPIFFLVIFHDSHNII